MFFSTRTQGSRNRVGRLRRGLRFQGRSLVHVSPCQRAGKHEPWTYARYGWGTPAAKTSHRMAFCVPELWMPPKASLKMSLARQGGSSLLAKHPQRAPNPEGFVVWK